MKKLFILLIISSLFSSCHKYPEDYRRYLFKSPIKRLIDASNWNLYAYTMNGVDSISNLMHRQPASYASSGSWIGFLVGTHTTSTSVDFNADIGTGTFKLINNNNQLNIIINSLKSGFYNPFINTSSNWDIEELTLKYLKIKSTINGINYEIFFAGG